MRTFPLWVLVIATVSLQCFGQNAKSRGQPLSGDQLAREQFRRTFKTLVKQMEFPVPGGTAYVAFGRMWGPLRAFRVLALRYDHGLHTDWDSTSLIHDEYFGVLGLHSFGAQADGPYSYTVSLSGCALHQCAEGKVGVALYSSQTNWTYVAHVVAEVSLHEGSNGDGTITSDAYTVTYLPKSGDSRRYRNQLDRLICKTPSYSRRALFPFRCD